MYVLKNLSKLNDLPDALRTRIFEKLFLKAEIAKLSEKDRKYYNQSLKNYRDMYSVLTERDHIIKERDQKIATLSKDVAVLSKDVAVLSKDVAVLSKDVAVKEKRIEVLQANFTTLQIQNAEKDAEIANLRRMLGINGTSVQN